MRNLLCRLSAGFVLAALHSVGVFWAWWQVTDNPGLLSGLNWVPVMVIDFPLILLIEVSGADDLLAGEPAATGLTLLIGGGLYWLLVGSAVRAAWRRFLRRLEWG